MSARRKNNPHLARFNLLQSCSQNYTLRTPICTFSHFQSSQEIFSSAFCFRFHAPSEFPGIWRHVYWQYVTNILADFVTFDLPEDLNSRYLRNVRNTLPVTRRHFQNTRLHQQLCQNLTSHVQHMFFAWTGRPRYILLRNGRIQFCDIHYFVAYTTLWHTPNCDRHYFVAYITLWHTLLCDTLQCKIHYFVTYTTL